MDNIPWASGAEDESSGKMQTPSWAFCETGKIFTVGKLGFRTVCEESSRGGPSMGRVAALTDWQGRARDN